MRLRVAASGFDHGDTAVDDGADIAGIVGRRHGRQEGQIHADRLVRHFAAAGNLVGQVFGCFLRQAGNHPQAAGIGDGCGQFGKAYIVHPALNDRMLDAKHFSDFRFHGPGLLLIQ